MKFSLVLFAFAIFSFSQAERQTGFIVGGSDATINEFPYMAGIQTFGITGCGGSIITSRSVLTVMTLLNKFVELFIV